MSTPVIRELAGRFVGGDDLASGLAAVRGLSAKGIKASLNFHGMHVLDPEEARRATEQAIDALRKIQAEGLDSHVSVKLTKIGLDLDPGLCRANLRRIIDAAMATGGFVRIDMEESVYVDQTIELFEEVQHICDGKNVGIVIQSYLRHRPDDLGRLMALGASIRLVKGGYREPREVVFRTKAEVDAAFLRDIRLLLNQKGLHGIATHDEEAIAQAKALQIEFGLDKKDFEFQMLFGVRPDLQEKLVAEGYSVRCYIPYGGDWATHLAGCLRRIPIDAYARLRRSLVR
ncbi:MAG: proline dehydrogenase family protein [Holophagaceae bacterium]|uniref:proline dehydrogenase n=1 Tax=Candidatus Geothrix skivensis TaxID=2954439 RepID=A0A9D7SH16_9BACT|nr:proline dehydrogenase family protein [Candidatus Geothrix skivensis]